jgi:calcineurin-like phosphoesterase family protein
MSKKWVISDLHLGHKNILTFSGPLRGGTSPEQHDEWVISQINSVVKKCDLLYILGDVALDRESLKKVSRIRGQKILIRGNHDIYSTQEYLQHFQQVYGLVSLKGTFWLSHAPIHPQELRDRYNIHGHVHQHSVLLEDGTPDPRYINACIETTYGVPQSIDDLMEKYKNEVHQKKLARKAAEKGPSEDL